MSQERFDEAIRLEESGQVEAALAVWRELAQTNPARNVFVRLGSACGELGLREEAEQAFLRAIEVDERCSVALFQLGLLAFDRGGLEDTVTWVRRACAIEEKAGYYSVLGVALFRTGNDLEAEQAYRKAIRLDPNYEEAYYNLGVLLRLRDRPSEAQAMLRKAIELDPDYAVAHRELGFVLLPRGIDPETEGYLRRAIELDPRDAWAHIYLGCYWADADPRAAEQEYRIAHEIHREWAVPLWSLGDLFEQSDPAKARSFYSRALELESECEQALSGLSRLDEQHEPS